MKKLAEFLINRRRVLTAVMLVLTAVCAVLALRVPINRDRTKYLADSSEMKQGLSIMEDVFPESDETASIRVMFDDLTADQIPEIKAQLEAIPNVSGVAYEAGSEEYNKDNHTLFVVNSRYDYDTDEEHAIEAAIEEGFPGYTMAYENNDVSFCWSCPIHGWTPCCFSSPSASPLCSTWERTSCSRMSMR